MSEEFSQEFTHGFAYFDQRNSAGVDELHVAPTEDEAKSAAVDGKYVSFDGPNAYGYPVIETSEGRKQVICYRYADGSVKGFIDGNEFTGKQVDVSGFQSVFDQLK